MSGLAAVHCIEDPFDFARAAGRRNGEVAIAAMRRLADRLSETTGAVSFVVNGSCDQRQRPMLQLEVSGELQLRCARCLAPMNYHLSLNARVLLAHPGALPQDHYDPESPEWIEAGRDLDLMELVEDEILLGMPFSVWHEQEECGSPEGGAARKGSKNSPFVGLATLLEPGQTDKR